MALMSRIISYSTADKADIVAYLGAAGRLTADQERRFGRMQERAEHSQRSLDDQGLDWGLPIPEALGHLLSGHADSDAECAASAYYLALQHIIDCNASDPMDLGVYSQPSTFFGLLDDELRRLGVSTDLLMREHLFAGPPEDIPFHIPRPVDGPHIGMFPLAKAKPTADAYRAVLDRLDEGFRYDVQVLIDKLEVEHDEWESSTKHVDWYTQDTIFFSIRG